MVDSLNDRMHQVLEDNEYMDRQRGIYPIKSIPKLSGNNQNYGTERNMDKAKRAKDRALSIPA